MLIMELDFALHQITRLRVLISAFLLMLAPFYAYGQGKAIEAELFDCIRSSFPDGGRSLDNLMASFESELISEGLLQSASASDYRGLLQRIASGQDLVRPVEQYFGPRYRSLEQDSSAYKKCIVALEGKRPKAPDSSLFVFEEFREARLRENMEASQEASVYLEMLSESDLSMPYFRLYTYELIDRKSIETEFANPPFSSLEQLGQLSSSGANIFRVYLNEENQHIVLDQLISADQLITLVSSHARTFEQSALYIIEVEPDVKYGSFIGLKDRIALAVSQVRDTYTRRILGKTLTELSAEEREVVFGKYPLRIVTP